MEGFVEPNYIDYTISTGCDWLAGYPFGCFRCLSSLNNTA